MITNTEIVDAYLRYKGMKLTDQEHRDDTRMLMPFFLMDASYQVYCRDIKDLEARHKLKAAKSKWKESYRTFNADFFMAFNPDQQDFIIDQMDEFETFIHNKAVMLKSTVMSVFSASASFEEKKILSAVMTCNVLAQVAQRIYGDMFRTAHFQKKSCPKIEGVIKGSYEYANNFPVAKNVDLTSSEKVMQAIDTLCKSVIVFIKTKFDETRTN